MSAAELHGYDYGAVARSPVAWDEFVGQLSEHSAEGMALTVIGDAGAHRIDFARFERCNVGKWRLVER